MTADLLDNIYVINLEQSIDRLNLMKNCFDEHNIKFKRFDAIYGRNLTNDVIDDNVGTLCKNLLCNYGMIGCAMSHIELWKKLVNDNGTDYYIIFEDDAIIDNDFSITINEINSIKYQLNFDILSLYCGPGPNCVHMKQIYTLDNGVSIGKPLFPLSLTSYIISKNGAIKLLSAIDKIKYHIDMDIALKNLSGYITYLSLDKNLVQHNWNTQSTIEHHNSKSILFNILLRLGFVNTYWLLNLSVVTIKLNYTINLYQILLIILIIIFVLAKIWILVALLSIELLLTFI